MAYAGGKYKSDHDVKNLYQAVVLTDTFNEKFHPLSEENLTVLFPLVNQPILEYTLRFLKAAEIEVVYIFCSQNDESIQDYLNKTSWLNPSNEMQISVIVSHHCMSLGDALREIDSRAIVRNDFVLVTAGVVSNISLKSVIEEHRESYKNNKQLVMTEIYTRALPRHRCRDLDNETVLVIEGKRILHHQKLGHGKKINFPLSIFQENNLVSIRHDLSGSHISICSPQVLSLFSDNFDFQTKDDFIKGILENEEILGSLIYAHVVDGEYACTISNFQTYDAVSKDVIDRWVYPFVPDVNLMPCKLGYTYLRQNVYLSKDVILPRTCTLRNKLIIGEGSEIGDGTLISKSVIGKNCKIGKNVKIENSFVWDNVKIGDGCVIKSAIIAHSAHLLEKVIISSGCVLSYNVLVGPNVTINEGVVLIDKQPKDDFGDQLAVQNIDVGTKGRAFVYHCNDMKSYVHYISSEPHVSDEDVPSTANETDVEESDEEIDVNFDDTQLFYNDVVDSLKRAVDDNIPLENLVLEINSSKHAYNVSLTELNQLVTKAVLETPNSKSSANLDGPQYFAKLKPILMQMTEMFKHYTKTTSSQLDCLVAMEDYFGDHNSHITVAMQIFHLFYDIEILTEEAILKWYNMNAKNDDLVVHNLIRNNEKIVGFIEWLKNAEEESEEDSD